MMSDAATLQMCEDQPWLALSILAQFDTDENPALYHATSSQLEEAM
jgi:hypothetical protein